MCMFMMVFTVNFAGMGIDALKTIKRTKVVSHYNHNEHCAPFAAYVFVIGVVSSTPAC